MNFLEEIKDKTHFKIIVKTNKPKTQILNKINDSYKMDVKAQVKEGKANIEIKKYFKKNHKLNIEIISGKTSKGKLIKIIKSSYVIK